MEFNRDQWQEKKETITLPKISALGLRRRHHDTILDVWYPLIDPQGQADWARLMCFAYGDATTSVVDAALLPTLKEMLPPQLSALTQISDTTEGDHHSDYWQQELVWTRLDSVNAKVANVEEAYLKLHLLSQRIQKPNTLNLDGAFATLSNIAWTDLGPILPQDIDRIRLEQRCRGEVLRVSHVDKFPYLVDYMIPDGVRIADGCRARLGAYLGQGTTIMPAGYVNFNAGTAKHAMVEGRISAGVFVDADSDIGGGASIMGTLSGGGKTVIRIGKNCLIGANAGTGISLGDGCTIAAGAYITAASKVSLLDNEGHAIDLEGQRTTNGKNIVKGAQLSERSHCLYLVNSQTGVLECRPNKKSIALNAQLHLHN